MPPGFHADGNPLDLTPEGVVNLGGNLQEWVTDDFALYDDACWSGPEPLTDPHCQLGSSLASVRGGSWQRSRHLTHSAARSPVDESTTDMGIGLRCARDAL